jgi:hypothetical protein
MFGLSTFSQAPYASLGSVTNSGVASINGFATLIAIGGLDIFASASITGLGTVTVNDVVVKDAGTASIFGNATVSAIANYEVVASGSILTNATVFVVTNGQLVQGAADFNALATVTADCDRVRLGDASIVGTIDFDALGGALISGGGSVLATGTFTAIGGVIYDNSGSITGTFTVTANGHILGNNWIDTPVEANSWKRIG